MSNKSTNPVQAHSPQTSAFTLFIGHLKNHFTLLPDPRKGKNIVYSITDAALSAFSVFFIQCPSFLAYQRHRQETQGQNNATSLFQVKQLPSDNQIRNLLDSIAPTQFADLFEKAFAYLEEDGTLETYRSLNNTFLLALDGFCYHSSNHISGENCSKRNKAGQINYSHSAMMPVVVAPNNPHALPMMPEFISPQEGDTKQDSENKAAKRWLKQHGDKLKQMGVTILGDDLYAHQPLCEAILDIGGHFILTCKPRSHKTLYQTLEERALEKKIITVKRTWRHGKRTYTDHFRFALQVPLREGEDVLPVNWCELNTTDATGKSVKNHSFITGHDITAENVFDVVEAARTRWKIKNENNNTLKTKGYHAAHNFGHGKQFLSQALLTLNVFSFLLHTILPYSDRAYRLIRDKLPTRQTFFNDLRALTRYMYFTDWQELLQFMMKGLKIKLDDSG
jgi:hypothetical protein